MPKEEKIDTKSATDKKADDKKDEDKKKVPKDDNGVPLTESDIALFTRYGKGPYNDQLKNVENEIKGLNQKITELIGIKESDTGLAPPSQWNIPQDTQMMK